MFLTHFLKIEWVYLALYDSDLALLLAHVGQNDAFQIESTQIGLRRLLYRQEWFESILQLGKQVTRNLSLLVLEIVVVMRLGQLEQTLHIFRLVHFRWLPHLELCLLQYFGVPTVFDRLLNRSLVFVVLRDQVGDYRCLFASQIFFKNRAELKQAKDTSQLIHLVDQLIELIQSVIDNFYEVIVFEVLSGSVESERRALSFDLYDDDHRLLVYFSQPLIFVPKVVLLQSRNNICEFLQIVIFANNLLNDPNLVACIFPSILPNIHQQPQQFCLQIVIAQSDSLTQIFFLSLIIQILAKYSFQQIKTGKTAFQVLYGCYVVAITHMVGSEVKVGPEVEVVQTQCSLQTLLDHSLELGGLLLTEDANSTIHETLSQPLLQILRETRHRGSAQLVLYALYGIFEKFICLCELALPEELCSPGELVFDIVLINNTTVIIHYKLIDAAAESIVLYFFALADHCQRLVDFVQVASDSGDGLHAVLEVHEGLPDELVRQFVGIADHEVGLVDLLHSELTHAYMAD